MSTKGSWPRPSGDKWYIVVSYDIVDDRRRTQVAKVLETYGERVQKSVFDCRLNEQRLLELQDALRAVVDESEDSVRYYRLCTRCEGTIHVQGCGVVYEEEPVIIV